MRLFDFFKIQATKNVAQPVTQPVNSKPADQSKPKADTNSKVTAATKQVINTPTEATLKLASVGF